MPRRPQNWLTYVQLSTLTPCFPSYAFPVESFCCCTPTNSAHHTNTQNHHPNTHILHAQSYAKHTCTLYQQTVQSYSTSMQLKHIRNPRRQHNLEQFHRNLLMLQCIPKNASTAWQTPSMPIQSTAHCLRSTHSNLHRHTLHSIIVFPIALLLNLCSQNFLPTV